jgi:hypothetical protein
MRVILAAAAALAAVTVSGCDLHSGPAKPAQVTCNCTAPATPPAGMRGSTAYAPPPAAPRRHRGYHHEYDIARWSGGHSHVWRREYAEVSVVTYDYHSGSRSYDTDAGGGAYTGDAVHGGDGYHGAAHGWVDGYGRGHGGGESVRDDTPADGRGRRDPWRGYDALCPDRERR